ncbi:MAG: disulfide bond formation protein B [Candidatus Buchananbacteria bacterium]|nr:disulfide bond formation protein B [Candidatus Buchananbacteria bacterium]
MLLIVNEILALGTLLTDIGIVVVGLLLAYPKTRKQIIRLGQQYGLQLAFVIAVISTALSLYYSEIAGFAPCVLCWWQRIFIYPQVILLGMMLWRKEYKIIDYAIAVLIPGLLVSIYQVALQFGVSDVLDCTAVGPSCDARYVYEYGYITIPVMALTALIAMLGLLLLARRPENKA